MKLPIWATLEHPIVRHEQLSWRRFLRRWWWLALLPIAFTLLTSVCSLVGNLPIIFQTTLTNNAPAEFRLIAVLLIAQTIIQTIWNINGSVQWVVSLAIGFGSAIAIARERESQNWALLRLTPMPATEIVLAKAVAIVRQFIWPLIITTAINIVGLALLTLGLVGGAVFLGQVTPELFNTGIPFWVSVIALLSLLPAIILMIMSTILDTIYNTSLGLLASAWANTRANAIAYAIVLQFVLNTFIYLPVFFLVIITAGAFGGLTAALTQSPLVAVIVLIGVAVVLFFFFRVAVVILAAAATRYQIQRLIE